MAWSVQPPLQALHRSTQASVRALLQNSTQPEQE
jgi:hypothetical protein